MVFYSILKVLQAIFGLVKRSAKSIAFFAALAVFLASMASYSAIFRTYFAEVSNHPLGCFAGYMGAWEVLRIILSTLLAVLAFRVTIAINRTLT